MTFDDAQHVFAPVRKGNSKGEWDDVRIWGTIYLIKVG